MMEMESVFITTDHYRLYFFLGHTTTNHKAHIFATSFIVPLMPALIVVIIVMIIICSAFISVCCETIVGHLGISC